MFKTTVYLPDSVKRRLRDVARRRGVSEAQLIRDALQRLVAEERPRPRAGLFSSGDPTLAERIDEELEKGFGEL